MSKSEKRNKKIYIGYMVLVVLLMCIGGIFVKNTIIHGNEGIITKNQITEVEEHDIELAPPKGQETFQHTTILEKDNRRAEAQKGVESNNRLSDEYEYLTR